MKSPRAIADVPYPSNGGGTTAKNCPHSDEQLATVKVGELWETPTNTFLIRPFHGEVAPVEIIPPGQPDSAMADMPSSQESLNEINGRVGKLEGEFVEIKSDVSGIKATVQGLSNDIRTVNSNVNALASEVRQGLSTKWSPILTGASVFVALFFGIATVFITLVILPMGSRIEAAFSRIDQLRESIVPRSEHEREWALSDRLAQSMDERLRFLENLRMSGK